MGGTPAPVPPTVPRGPIEQLLEAANRLLKTIAGMNTVTAVVALVCATVVAWQATRHWLPPIAGPECPEIELCPDCPVQESWLSAVLPVNGQVPLAELAQCEERLVKVLVQFRYAAAAYGFDVPELGLQLVSVAPDTVSGSGDHD